MNGFVAEHDRNLAEQALDFFSANQERFSRINATRKMAGFRLGNGHELALLRESDKLSLFVTPGDWQQRVQVLESKSYAAQDSRHSNLASCAPALGGGRPLLSIKLADLAALKAFCLAYGTESMDEPTTMQLATSDLGEYRSPPLNQILYGPPGTGKTYETIDAALQILAPEYLSHSREQRKQHFDEFVSRRCIRFVTFHQSFSYEDFVEGLRASTGDEGILDYRVEPGVLKQLCEDASCRVLGDDDSFEQALEQLKERLESASGRASAKTVTGRRFAFEYVGGETFRVFPEGSLEQKIPYRASLSDIRRLYRSGSKQRMHNASYVQGILQYMLQECGLPKFIAEAPAAGNLPNYVLIIDEINRGNVSRIFGELITLIEDSKRAGNGEALSVVLPYSKERFSIPSNVYLIGTMNTTDRSLAGLDIALRRRFVFREMPPRPELLDEVQVQGLNIGQLLRTLNQRIEVLLGRDHCLGHAYFLPLRGSPTLQQLEAIFRNQILPLLQEYFFEDWQRIQWVLNDHRKSVADQFVQQASPDMAALFGNISVPAQGAVWRINEKAFKRFSAYAGVILSAQGELAVNAFEEADV